MTNSTKHKQVSLLSAIYTYFCKQYFQLCQRSEKNTEKDRETDERGLFAGHSSTKIQVRISFYICLPFHLIERANDLFESQLTECRVGGMDRKQRGKQA